MTKLSKSPTINGRPWREHLDQLDEWEIRYLESVERDYAKPRIQKWAENKWRSLRSKWLGVKIIIKDFRERRYVDMIGQIIVSFPERFVQSHDGQYESGMCIEIGPFCMSQSDCNVLSHQDAEISVTIRNVTYTYRWVQGDEPIRDPGFSKFDQR